MFTLTRVFYLYNVLEHWRGIGHLHPSYCIPNRCVSSYDGF